MLPNRVSGRTDRSRLRGPRVVRRFPHHLLHRQRTRILLRNRSGWRDPRLLARLAQAAPESILFLSPKLLALSAHDAALPSLQPAIAAFHSLDDQPRLARGAGRAQAHAAFPYQPPAGRSQAVDDACVDE